LFSVTSASNAVIENLSTIADSHPAAVASVTLPELFSKLPSPHHLPSVEASPTIPPVASAKYVTILDGLASLCDRATLFDSFLVRLFDALESSCNAAFQVSVKEFLSDGSNRNQPFDYRAYSHHLIICLHTVIQAKINSFNPTLKSPASDMAECAITATQARGIIGRLFEILLCEGQALENLPDEGSGEPSGVRKGVDPSVVREHCTICNDKRIVINAGRIINSTMSQLDFQYVYLIQL
jgi:hypothetical protein